MSEVRRALSHYAARFDAALVSAADATAVMREAAAIRNVASTLEAMAAGRVAETSQWRRAGDRSAAHHYARETGRTTAQAAEAMETAQRLKQLPDADAAARRGELSPEQASAIARAAAADPSSERRLVDTAKRVPLSELRRECAKTKLAADADREARRRRIHARRSLRSWTDDEGVWHLHMRENPEVGAQIMARIDEVAEEVFKAARAEGRREPHEAYAADALTRIVTGAGPGRESGDGGEAAKVPARRSSSARAKVIVRVDLSTLLRGYPTDGEVCEIAGFGPVSVSAVIDLIETGDPFLAAVVTKGVRLTGVAHLGRRANAYQQTALEFLYPMCANEACSAVARLQNDHRIDWAKIHLTAFELLDRFCPHDHDKKTRLGWALVEGRGRRAFVPPDDPRHPANAGRASESARPPPPGTDEAA